MYTFSSVTFVVTASSEQEVMNSGPDWVESAASAVVAATVVAVWTVADVVAGAITTDVSALKVVVIGGAEKVGKKVGLIVEMEVEMGPPVVARGGVRVVLWTLDGAMSWHSTGDSG